MLTAIRSISRPYNYHWNVSGPQFATLHVLFGAQYNERALAVDQIADRIRALDHAVPGSYRAFSALSSRAEDDGAPAADRMMRRRLQGQETGVGTARGLFDAVEQARDAPTTDLLTQRTQVHEKSAWMLRSLLATD